MNTFRLKSAVCLLLSAAFSFTAATAQSDGKTPKRIILASMSPNHPYERPQWSEAQAKEWFDSVGPIIGINHPVPPCGAVSQDEALAKAASMGFNSVRWFLGGGTAAEFINLLENAAEMAHKYNMTVSPVLTAAIARIPNSTSDSLNIETQVRQIARHFRGDKRIILWDLWNEPAMYDTNTPKIMEMIRRIAQWMREEGCTQAISASIVWDLSTSNGGQYAAQRNAAEAEMDVHNFHDYAMSGNMGGDVQTMVNRLKKISDRPMIATEVLTRDNGSGVAMSLRQCAKFGIGFYSWGLYSCDSPWDVRWDHSTFYAWEPNFHNLLYAGGDAIDRREEEYIKKFRYTQEQIYPGMEETDRWTERRAWKWMADEPLKIRYANSVADANTFINAHGSEGAYNCIAVRLSYANYTSNNSSYLSSIDNLATRANAAGFKLLPILLTSMNINANATSLGSYTYNVLARFKDDRRFAGWCLFEQTTASLPSTFKTKMASVCSRTRYSFTNQPMFLAPKINADLQADSTATDEANYMWQLSDVTAFTTGDNGEVTAAQLKNIFNAYHRPLFFLNAPKLQEEFAPMHVNWATTADISADEVKAFANSPLNITDEGDANKMPSWKAWAQMNCGPVKGLYYKNVADALAGIAAQGPKGIYNSVAVLMNFDTYNRTKDTYMAQFNQLLDSAGKYGMTVVPMLLNDAYARRNATAMQNYVEYMISTYNADPRIFAWEIYNRAGTTATYASRLSTLIPQLFEAARKAAPNRPVFATPAVSVNKFDADFDYIKSLTHAQGSGGWNRLNYGNSNVDLVYMCWKLSDIVSINSTQDSPELGWLNAVGYRFGRPMICTCWDTANSSTIDATLDIFTDHHEPFFVDGNIDDAKVSAFKYRTIITKP